MSYTVVGVYAVPGWAGNPGRAGCPGEGRGASPGAESRSQHRQARPEGWCAFPGDGAPQAVSAFLVFPSRPPVRRAARCFIHAACFSGGPPPLRGGGNGGETAARACQLPPPCPCAARGLRRTPPSPARGAFRCTTPGRPRRHPAVSCARGRPGSAGSMSWRAPVAPRPGPPGRRMPGRLLRGLLPVSGAVSPFQNRSSRGLVNENEIQYQDCGTAGPFPS